jgi:uncharacterized protein (DUF1330 family)
VADGRHDRHEETVMPGYVIGTLEVSDPSRLDEYVGRVGKTIERHGGRMLAAGPAAATWEGEAQSMAAVIEFPSVDAATRWYGSAEYRAIRHLRSRAAALG